MNYSIIVSVKLEKKSGEYFVKRRSAKTGKTIITSCNRLKEDEKEFANNCKHYYEDSTCVWWVN